MKSCVLNPRRTRVGFPILLLLGVMATGCRSPSPDSKQLVSTSIVVDDADHTVSARKRLEGTWFIKKAEENTFELLVRMQGNQATMGEWGGSLNSSNDIDLQLTWERGNHFIFEETQYGMGLVFHMVLSAPNALIAWSMSDSSLLLYGFKASPTPHALRGHWNICSPNASGPSKAEITQDTVTWYDAQGDLLDRGILWAFDVPGHLLQFAFRPSGGGVIEHVRVQPLGQDVYIAWSGEGGYTMLYKPGSKPDWLTCGDAG